MKNLKQSGLSKVAGLTIIVTLLAFVVTLGLQTGRAEAAARCDLGVNSKAFNDKNTTVSSQPSYNVIKPATFTVSQWAAKFTPPGIGLTSTHVTNRVNADEMYRRQVEGGVLTQKLSADTWIPMTDLNQCKLLAHQLQQARFVAAQKWTADKAVAGGYTRSNSAPLGGMGVHYQNSSLLGSFNPEKPAQLLYDTTRPTAPIVGLSYFVNSGANPPAGFAGPNDRWHRIKQWCLDPQDSNRLIAAEILSKTECENFGGMYLANPGIWTLHVWVVPGCESEWGVFSVSNPRIPYLPNTVTRHQGCGTNTDIGSQLMFDRTGTGPKVY